MSQIIVKLWDNGFCIIIFFYLHHQSRTITFFIDLKDMFPFVEHIYWVFIEQFYNHEIVLFVQYLIFITQPIP